MGAIVLDASKVNSYVLPNLVKSKNTMQDAYSTSQALRNSLPSSFTYRSTINDIVNQLYSIKREISDIDTIISKKVEKAKTIENRNDNRASGIAKAASSIGSVVGTIGGAMLGSATGGVVGAVAGAVVGNEAGNSTGKGLANTGAKIWNGATKVVKSIGNGIKNLGTAIWNGCKKVAKSVKSVWQKFTGKIKNFGSKVINIAKKIGKSIYNTGAKLVKGCISVCKKIDTGIRKVYAKIARGVTTLTSKILNGITKLTKNAVNAYFNLKAKIGNKIISKVEKITGWDLTWVRNVNSAVSNFIVSAVDKVGNFVCNVVKGIGNWVADLIEHPWATIKKTAATVVNVVMSLVEGVASFVEATIDGTVLITVTSVTGVIDIWNGITKGDWTWASTKAVVGKKVLPWISKDYVKTGFDKLYGTEFGKWLDTEAYSPFKRDGGTVYSVVKGVGYYVGIAIASIYTAGGAAAAAGVAQLGKSASANYNTAKNKQLEQNPELTEEQIIDKIAEEDTGKILLQSGGEAAVEAAAVYFAAGAKKGLTDKMGKEVLKQSFGKRLMVNGTSGVIKGTKAYAKEGLTMISDGEFDGAKATEEFVATVGAEVVAGEITNKLDLSKKMINYKKQKIELQNNNDQNTLQGFSESETGTEVSKFYEGVSKFTEKMVTKTEAETTKTVVKEVV